MRFYRLWPLAVGELRYTGEYNASRKWMLPGVHCPACNAIWGGGLVFPCVDLSTLPVSKMLGEARLEEDFRGF
ncbi:double-CXXCG motif protein [Archangium lansingense]|uniref:double-CXXCG motif protein n=1 Tax=Archangium lansingense TaxID=2995310 RepID=UPI003B791053